MVTTLADPKLAVRDRQLLSVILRAALTRTPNFFSRINYLFTQLRSSLSILGETALKDLIDHYLIPMIGEWLKPAQKVFMIPWRSKMAGVLVPATISERSNANTPTSLTVKTHAFVTQVLFESKRLMDYTKWG